MYLNNPESCPLVWNFKVFDNGLSAKWQICQSKNVSPFGDQNLGLKYLLSFDSLSDSTTNSSDH